MIQEKLIKQIFMLAELYIIMYVTRLHGSVYVLLCKYNKIIVVASFDTVLQRVQLYGLWLNIKNCVTCKIVFRNFVDMTFWRDMHPKYQ
jgi:hypothetical protein